jgi:N-carbamoylputrescine amidase
MSSPNRWAVIETDRARLETVLGEALDAGVLSDVTIANSENERRAIWAIREDVWQVRNIGAALLTFVVSLPIENMKAYAGEVCESVRAFAGDNRCFVFGHMADGNLHIVVAAGDDASTRTRVEDLVYRPLAAIGGSVSAEHGIGLEKRAYLPLSRTPAEISTMRLLARTGSQGHPEPGEGVRMNQPAHLVRSERKVTVAAMQFACSWDVDRNIATAERLVREAAKRGAQIILIQELFETPYFCIEQDSRHLRAATTVADNRAIRHFAPIARELGVVLPISFFERANNSFFNSIAILDADGTNLGVYRKAHIPNGPGYQEKNYFSPGDTGFMVFNTRYARIGVAICWDQWFPECARAMALKGAELLFYPTAIGSEPPPALPVNSRDHWQRTQQGHAAANLMPVVVSNRIGTERALQDPENVYIRFYGSSFIADATAPRWPRRTRRATVITANSISRRSVICATTGSYSAIGGRTCTVR